MNFDFMLTLEVLAFLYLRLAPYSSLKLTFDREHIRYIYCMPWVGPSPSITYQNRNRGSHRHIGFPLVLGTFVNVTYCSGDLTHITESCYQLSVEQRTQQLSSLQREAPLEAGDGKLLWCFAGASIHVHIFFFFFLNAAFLIVLHNSIMTVTWWQPSSL